MTSRCLCGLDALGYRRRGAGSCGIVRDRAGVFEALIDDAVDHGFPAECAKTLRDIVCRKRHEVFRILVQGDPPARVST